MTKSRFLARAGSAYPQGTLMKLHGKVVRIDGAGKSFYADDDIGSFGYPGWEGERVCYVYYCPATEAEEAQFAQEESEREAKRDVVLRRKAAVAKIAAGEEAPETGRVPDGERVWSDSSCRGVGYETYVILGTDGYAYHITYDGSDGGMWGAYNCGYNTHGKRIQATPEIIEALRAA